MEKKKKNKKRTGASFKKTVVHSDKLSAYKAGEMDMSSNKSSGPDNRADKELSHMMTHKPAGMKQKDRRKK